MPPRPRREYSVERHPLVLGFPTTPQKSSKTDRSQVHETWNRTAEDRVLLLFDVWHPELGDDEIEAVVAMLAEAGRRQ